ncbi:ATP-dependent DNA helicase [Ruania alba]|uniref:DNA 3'-5' helicase n=1 Tax=Ruania alba TaxID=648782 RepID=A0A1H5CV84_9MICO|nr:ATP-dependent DNA helicase [Ruania alba]SED70483.1 DNA helicase-2 / ATP-dependent DNA helicase PcrA [Ruania alba]
MSDGCDAPSAAADVEWTAARIAETLGQPPPTAEQRLVIESGLEPMLVVAGAGSGKTETMAARVVYLVANGIVAPGEILGLTFTRKAAAELSGRIRARLRRLQRAGVSIGDTVADRPRIATYNSYAAAIVADHALRIGIDPDATLIGDAGRYQLAESVVNTWAETIETPSAVTTVIDAVAALAAELSEHGRTPDEAAAVLTDLMREIEEKEVEPGARAKGPLKAARDLLVSLRTRTQVMDVVAEFARRKRADGVVDFGDQVRIAATVAEQVSDVGVAERSRYQVVLLDEYQDTSIAQVQLLRALFDGGHPVTAVGDPNQAIYGWRGAAAGTLLAFPEVFRAADGSRAGTANLSTAWRNDLAILRAANTVAAPLLTEGVAELQPRPGAAEGAVHARYPETAAEEAEIVASFLRRHWHPEHGSAAVLCRRRAQFPVIERAIREAGLPCQVVGLAGLLATPEVADVRATLQVAHDPSRGDALMRLLTGPSVNLGASDLRVLSEWARTQARSWRTTGEPALATQGTPSGVLFDLGSGEGDAPSGTSAEATAKVSADRDERAEVLEPVEQASLVEAIDRLPPPAWRTAEGRTLSPPARDRLNRLADQVRLVRSLTHLGIPELVTATEQALDLDIEVLAAVPGSAGHARRHLDAFTAAAADFSRDAEAPTLGAFLSYLDVAEDEERGLEVVEAEPDPHAIQIMTVHAAKGLEWDAVVVVGMNVGDFPSVNPIPKPEKPFTGSGWLSGIATLPYPLRGDRDSLPELDLAAPSTHQEVDEALAQFRLAEGQRLLLEERRLAYVALTRARHHLLLTGSFWGERQSVNRPSPFLTEVVLGELAQTGGAWPQQSATEKNPATEEVRTATWPTLPPQVSPSWWRLWDDAAEPSPAEGRPEGAPDQPPAAPDLPEDVRFWWRDAALLLAERDGARAAGTSPPAHLSASAVVALAQDPESFRRSRRRPVPSRPSVHARRGTRFHAWVEQHFGSRALIDWDSLPGADDDLSGTDPELEELRRAFLASEWAHRSPVDVEADIETPVRGVMIRCRIDAVFADEHGIHIVDWKTGSPPRDPAATRARQMQLALYRVAWSRLHGTPLETVRASFYYVAEGVTVSGDEITEGEIEEVLAAAAEVNAPS